MNNERLEKQMAFLTEVEKLKIIYRQNMVIDGSRPENSAEHSWHLALMALILGEHSVADGIDILKVIRMVLIHDIVEIDAGDTFLYDERANLDKDDREQQAARRVFGMLPEEQKTEFIALWREFEERQTPEALFAASLDGMQPVVNHYHTGGAAVKKHKLKMSQIIEKKKFIEQGSPALWDYTQETILKSRDRGFYEDE